MIDYRIYVCLSCGTQARGPGGHSVSGDEVCPVCPVHGGQPRLARVSVRVADEGTSNHLARAERAAVEAREARSRR